MLAARGALPPAGAAMVAAQACVALAAAHASGPTHGHLTPANVLLCIDGRVKLTDFRLAQAAKPLLVAPGPEDDLHALGRCLVVMLTGREPPGEPVWLGPEVPGKLATIVRRATGQRGGYASASDLGRDLVRFLATVRPGLALPGQPAPVLGHDPGDLAGTPPPARRRRLALAAGVAGAWLAVVAVVAVGLPRGGPHRPAASRTPAPPSSAVLAPTTSDLATSTTPSQAPTTAPPTTAAGPRRRRPRPRPAANPPAPRSGAPSPASSGCTRGRPPRCCNGPAYASAWSRPAPAAPGRPSAWSTRTRRPARSSRADPW
ncbi:MAG TPA: hypothetical protein VF486_01165 [Actinomycetes bacterium]